MIWERSDVIALAKEGCTRCGGSGFHTWNSTWVCDCVRRGVFRACYERFKHCAKSYSTGGVRYELVSGAVNSPRAFGRKNSEYIIDFELIAKRTLTEQEYKLFRYHFLLGAEWKLCCRRLNMECSITPSTASSRNWAARSVRRSLTPFSRLMNTSAVPCVWSEQRRRS